MESKKSKKNSIPTPDIDKDADTPKDEISSLQGRKSPQSKSTSFDMSETPKRSSATSSNLSRQSSLKRRKSCNTTKRKKSRRRTQSGASSVASDKDDENVKKQSLNESLKSILSKSSLSNVSDATTRRDSSIVRIKDLIQMENAEEKTKNKLQAELTKLEEINPKDLKSPRNSKHCEGSISLASDRPVNGKISKDIPTIKKGSSNLESRESFNSRSSVNSSEFKVPEKAEKSTMFDTRFNSIRSLGSSMFGAEEMDEMEESLKSQFLNDQGYEKIKEVYQEIMEHLRQHEDGHVCLEPARDEFVSLWDGIEASRENEKKLMKKDQELSVELSTTMAKTRNLVKLAEDDPILARKLGQALERAWTLADIGDQQEATNQAKLEHLRQEIFDLNRNINAASHVEGQDTVKELQKMKFELEKQRDSANIEANRYRSSLNILFAKRQELFERRTNLEEKSKLLDEEYDAQNEAIERETDRKEKLAAEMQEVQGKLEKKQGELDELEQTIQYSANKILDTERAVLEQTLVSEGAMRDQDLSVNRLEKLRNEFDMQQRVVERLTMAAYRQVQELKTKDGEVNFLRLELARAMRQRSLHTKRVILLQQTMATLDQERENLKGKINTLEKELEAAQRKLDENKRNVERLDKERSLVNRNLKRAEALTSEHTSQVKTHEVAVQNLETAVTLFGDEILTQKATITRLENERDFYSLESTKMAQQLAFQLTELKKLDLGILNYKKKLGLLDTQLKKTRQTYDLAVYDKGVFERALSDTLTEIMENSTNIKLLNNQVASLKYQVNQKDEVIHQEVLRYDRILKETEYYSKESQRIQRMAEDIQRHTEALEIERSTLGCAIAEIEAELGRENYYANAAESRIDVFQQKLMDQDIELRKIWEKWRTLYSRIRIGAYHYRNLMRDICSIRFNILTNRKLQDSQKKMRGNYGRLRREVTILENSISREKCIINALKEQMKQPLNVHRWRVLEATNPTAYEMILKINLLTRRLVGRNSQLKEQARQLMEKETIYVEMRKGLERSPGLETPEEVVYYQHLLVAKKQQLESLKHELKAAEVQTKYYREQVISLNEKMKDLKGKYFKSLQGGRKASMCKIIPYTGKKIQEYPVLPEDYDFQASGDG